LPSYFSSPFFAQAQFKITVSRSKNPIYFRGTLFDEKNFLAKDTVRGTVLSSKTPINCGIYYLQSPPQKSASTSILRKTTNSL
jgi:hypothetical protein